MTVSGSDDRQDGEVELFDKYQINRDRKIRDEIFSLYQGLVHGIVRKFYGASEHEDLLQIGYIGLLNAIDRFDPSRELKFSTYANHCIEGEIRHFLRDRNETIRRPRWMRQLSTKVAAFLEKFLQENERLPTLVEISEELNISVEGVQAILKSKHPASLDDDESDLYSSVKSLRHVSFQLPIEDRISISEGFEKLLELEQKVIYLFFVQDFTQKEIAGRLLLSPRKVSRVMQKGLSRLRGYLEGKRSD